MKNLVVMFLVIITTLFIGTLVGVQHMNEELGISQPEPLTYEQNNIEHVHESIIIGELIEKKQKIAEVGRNNFFSEVGRSLAEGINQASRSFLSLVMSFVHTVLNGEG